MLQLIQKVLKKENIEVWQIKKTISERAELYFVKKQLDIPRFAQMSEYQLSVYRDFEENGRKFRGVSVCYAEEGQSEAEIEEKIKNAYYAAQFVKNPYYDLADKTVAEHKKSLSDLVDKNIQEIANSIADAVLSVKTDHIAFVNSLEIFAVRSTVEILASNGLHVSFDNNKVTGEFVTQCKEPVDVEQFRSFSYDNLDTEALKEKISSAIEDVRLRANAKESPKTGKYNVLLTGERMREFLSYYIARSNAAMIFPGYSTWKKSDCVQKAGNGEKLNIELVATDPYSSDGVEMHNLPLIKDGILQNVWGPTRFMRYMNEKPSGLFEKMRVSNGSMSFKEMKEKADIETVAFSDFQMDSFTGNFGGEMRLCLLNDHGKDVPLTGGSINGKVSEIEDKLIFSFEKYEDGNYSGPYAVLVPDIPVAGK